MARTERPILPTLSDEATRTERLTPLRGRKSGEMILIDKGEYGEQLDLLAEAAKPARRREPDEEQADDPGSVWSSAAPDTWRPAEARNAYDRCVKAIFETGRPPDGCEHR